MSETSAGYSLENARRFGWSSVIGTLNPERVAHLDKYLRGEKVLDAGCGGGGFVEFLAARGLDVTGLDYHAEFLPSLGDTTRKGRYVKGDITAMPFPTASFDTTFCYDVLEHVDDVAALREMLRVTRDRVILAVPATDQNQVDFGLTFRHYQDLTHLRTYTADSLAAMLRAVGQERFEIFPELPVGLHLAAIHHLDSTAAGSKLRKKLQELYHALLRRLLSRARYRTIYSGLVAVIEVGSTSGG